ncbi:ATP-binding protein [Alcanivorax quisquiliarum]|uniref:histidine kinase n=1 Tax=Alcanivorax quisquiliarum TaxID=2933565 RepID=A0ABT0E506_9GAMM|nr:ATP-binding protein [Alcanivorax quisquiliarum]
MYSVFPATIAVLFLAYGGYVLSHARINRVTLSFFVLCSTTFAWQAAWALLFQIDDPQWAERLVRLGYLPILFLPTTLYHFLVEITGQRHELRRVYASYGLAALLAFTLLGDLFVRGYYEMFFGFYPKAGVLHPIHVLQTCVVVLRGLYLTWRAQQTAAPRQRTRLRYCIASLFIYLFAAIDYLCNYGVEIYPPGVFFLALSLGLLAIATVRYQLMDISLALSRGLARVTTLLLFATLYLAAFLALSVSDTDLPPVLAGALGLSFLVFVCETYGPLSTFLAGVPDRLLQRRRRGYSYPQVVQAVTRALGSHIRLDELVRDLADVLATHARIRPLTLFIRTDFGLGGDMPDARFHIWRQDAGEADPRETLPADHPLIRQLRPGQGVVYFREAEASVQQLYLQYQAASAVRIQRANEVVGVLLLGKQDNAPHYSHDDLDLIEFLPGQLDLAFDRVEAYSQVCHGLAKAQKSASLMATMNEYQHELKAPISIIHMYAQSNLSSDVVRSEILTQCQRVLGLLEKMLRVLQDKRDRQSRPVSINALLISALRLFPVRQAEVVLHLDEQLPPVIGDSDDLLILFINLLKNAVEAGDRERPNVIMLYTRYQPERHRVLLTLSDSGIGMDAEKLRRMWAPLESGKAGGTGLGMKVVQRIIQEHRADIDIQSTPGQGTQVDISLPVTELPSLPRELT